MISVIFIGLTVTVGFRELEPAAIRIHSSSGRMRWSGPLVIWVSGACKFKLEWQTEHVFIPSQKPIVR